MTTAAPPATSTYREIFAIGEFRALFAINAATVAGGTMASLALSALVYEHTGSPLLAALAYLAGVLPQMLGAATLLSLADRLPPRLFLAGWDLARAGTVVVLALGVLPVGGMLALVMAAGVVDSLAMAMRTALLADVVPDRSYVLGRSVLNISVGAMQITGFAVGGVLLAAIGPYAALYVAAGMILLSSLITRFGLAAKEPRATGRASLAATWRGNRALLGDPAIRPLLLAMWFPNGLIVGAEALFVPYAGNAAGVLFTAAALGMLVGDVVIGRWVGPARRIRLIVPLYALLAVPYIAFLWHPPVWAAAALVAVASVGYGSYLGLQERFLQVVPEDLRGQGFGLAGSGLLTMQAVGAAVSGVTAEALSPAAAMTAVAPASLAVTARLAPALRRPRSPKGERS